MLNIVNQVEKRLSLDKLAVIIHGDHSSRLSGYPAQEGAIILDELSVVDSADTMLACPLLSVAPDARGELLPLYEQARALHGRLIKLAIR